MIITNGIRAALSSKNTLMEKIISYINVDAAQIVVE
jgi:hypothetical protein